MHPPESAASPCCSLPGDYISLQKRQSAQGMSSLTQNTGRSQEKSRMSQEIILNLCFWTRERHVQREDTCSVGTEPEVSLPRVATGPQGARSCLEGHLSLAPRRLPPCLWGVQAPSPLSCAPRNTQGYVKRWWKSWGLWAQTCPLGGLRAGFFPSQMYRGLRAFLGARTLISLKEGAALGGPQVGRA